MLRQHHNIWTPELVEISLPLAGLARRCVARLVDALLLGIVNILVIVGFVVATGWFLQEFNVTGPGWIVLVLIIGMFLWVILSDFCYTWALHTFNNGQTLGKKWMGIRVVTTRGGRINGGTAFLRSLFNILDMMLASGGVSALLILLGTQEKSIPDYAAGTLVILDKEPGADGEALTPELKIVSDSP